MKTKAALLSSQPGKWEITEVDLDEPRDREVRLRMVAAGLCHSDDHMVTGDLPVPHLPLCGGHEGAPGIVDAVGPGVRYVKPGDHVVVAFIPGCGRCRWCAGGQQQLCDEGAGSLEGKQQDGTFRMHANGQDVARVRPGLDVLRVHRACSEASCVVIPDEDPAGRGLPGRLRGADRLGRRGDLGAGRARRRHHRDGRGRDRDQRGPGRGARRSVPGDRGRPGPVQAGERARTRRDRRLREHGAGHRAGPVPDRRSGRGQRHRQHRGDHRRAHRRGVHGHP